MLKVDVVLRIVRVQIVLGEVSVDGSKDGNDVVWESAKGVGWGFLCLFPAIRKEVDERSGTPRDENIAQFSQVIEERRTWRTVLFDERRAVWAKAERTTVLVTLAQVEVAFPSVLVDVRNHAFGQLVSESAI